MSIQLQANNESLAAENAQLQLQIERIRQETIEECAKLVMSAPMMQTCGEYLYLNDDCKAMAVQLNAALRSLTQGAGQPQHLPVQAEQPVDEPVAWMRPWSLGPQLRNSLESIAPIMRCNWIPLYTRPAATPCPPSSAQGNEEPPREVWVVSSPTGPDFVASYRQGAMEHAAECAGEFPENGPFRVCRYIAEPFAALQSAAPIEEREALPERLASPKAKDGLLRECLHALDRSINVSLCTDIERVLAVTASTAPPPPPQTNEYVAPGCELFPEVAELPPLPPHSYSAFPHTFQELYTADQMREYGKRCAALSAPAIPEGHVIVPIEPTPKMVDATFNHPQERDGKPESHNARNRRIYRAMLAAAQIPASAKTKEVE